MDRFSSRYGFQGDEPEITIREDAPVEVRAFVLSKLKRYAEASHARELVCETLHKLPSQNDWIADPIWVEVQYYIENCEWFLVYDLIEAINLNLQQLKYHRNSGISPFDSDEFAQELNAIFNERGIGWKLEDGRILARGPESFEAIIRKAPCALETAGMTTASDEIHKAIEDLSKRPNPDLTGAVQHGMAALECAGKYICGMTGKETLDDVVKSHPELFPSPMDQAVLKLWGFASNRGRHLQQGGEPAYADVELVVGVAATMATYLSRVTRPQAGGPGLTNTK